MILWQNYYLIKSSIDVRFGDLLKSSNYEALVGQLMNKSKVVFPHGYIHQEEQSSGQCDYIDSITGEKFDAKLPLSRKDGKQIGSNKGNVGNFSKIMYQEAAEFRLHPENMANHDSLVMGLGLYKIMKDLIAKTNPDEHVVFFIPYPIVIDFTGFPLSGIVDILKSIYRLLNRELDLGEKQIYAIYVAYDKKVVLRNLGKDKREYIEFDELRQFVNYEVITMGDKD